jgi:predicted acyltransferase
MANQNRRKFLFAGVSLAAIWATLLFTKKPQAKEKVKFLTQDGKLVEIEIDKLPPAKRMASGTDIETWIKNKVG